MKVRLLILFILGLVTACGAAPTATPRPTIAPPTVAPTRTPRPVPPLPTAADFRPQDGTNIATIRFLNGTQQMLDVYFEGNLVGGNLEFGTPTDTTLIKPGDYRLRVFRAGEQDVSKALLEQKISLIPDDSAVFVVSTTPGTADKFQLSVYLNNLKQIRKGTARLTFGQALSSRGSLTISENDKTLASLGNVGDAMEALDIALGAHKFEFAQGQSLQISLPLTILDLRAYLVIAVGDDRNAKVVVFADGADREIQVRVLNASLKYNTDKQPLDIYIDSRQVADDLAYGKATDFIKLPSRFYLFKVLKGSDKAEAKPLFDLRIEPSSDALTVVVFDGKNGLSMVPVPEDLTPTSPNFGRLVIVNAVPNVEGLRLVRAGTLDTHFRPIPFGESSTPSLMLSGPSDIAFRNDSVDDPQVVEIKQTFPLKAGFAYLYIAGASSTREPLVLNTEVGTGNIVQETPQVLPQIQMRFLNGFSDGTTATIRLGGRDIFANVQAGKISLPLIVKPQDAELAIVSTKDNKVLRSTRFQTNARGTMLLLALGTAGSPRFLQLRSNAPVSPSSAVLQVFHAGTGMQAMFARIGIRSAATPVSGSSIDRVTKTPSLALQALQPVGERLEVGEFVTDFPVSSGNYTLYVYDAKTGKVLGMVDIDVAGSHRYDVLILPAANGTIALNLYTTEDIAPQ